MLGQSRKSWSLILPHIRHLGGALEYHFVSQGAGFEPIIFKSSHVRGLPEEGMFKLRMDRNHPF